MNYEVAPFPLNNPPTPTTLEVACNSADALHAVLLKFTNTVLLKTKIYPQILLNSLAVFVFYSVFKKQFAVF